MANLVVGASNKVKIRELRDADGDFDVTATVTVELRDSGNNLVTGDTFPKTMPYITGTGADYQVFLDPALNITLGAVYKETVFATATTGEVTPFVTYRTAVESGGCA